MMKKIVSVFFALILTFSSSLCIYAENTQDIKNKNIVYDNANVISEQDESQMNEKIRTAAEKLKLNIAFITTEDMQTNDIKQYSSDRYNDIFGENTDGIIYTVDFNTRTVAAWASGNAADFINDERQRTISGKTAQYLTGQNYIDACETFLTLSEGYYDLNVLGTDAVDLKDPNKVYDNAEMVSDEEEAIMNMQIQKFAEKLQMNIAFITTNDTEIESIKEYAEDLYKNTFGSNTNGIIYVADFNKKSIAVSVSGKTEHYIKSIQKTEIINKTKSFLNSENYLLACRAFLDITDKYLGVSVDIKNITDKNIVFDNAGVISDEDEILLNMEIQSLAEELNWNIAFVTTNSTDGKEIKMYAADYYDDLFGINTNGVIYAIDFDTRKYAAVTSGEAILYLDDYRLDKIIDGTVSYLKSQDYVQVCRTFLSMTDNYYKNGIPDSNSNYTINENGDYTKKPADKKSTVLKALAGGLFVGIIISVIVIVTVLIRYRKHAPASAAVYMDQKNSLYRVKTDTYLRSYKTSRYIGSNDSGSSGSSGGGSSTFSSSSGGTHGGRSGSF